jgi:hypothetical protein
MLAAALRKELLIQWRTRGQIRAVFVFEQGRLIRSAGVSPADAAASSPPPGAAAGTPAFQGAPC